MKLHYKSSQHVSHVDLLKDGNSSVGIVIKGGRECGMRPIIKAVKNGSLAYKSHCVSEGDVILSLCGRDSRGMTKSDVKRLLKDADPRIEMDLQYEMQEAVFGNFGVYRFQQLGVTLRKQADSFGFVLRKNGLKHSVCTEYPIIGSIKPGSPADNIGSMRPGDHLIQIDDQCLSWMSLLEVTNILNSKEEATFLIEYSIGIVDHCIQPGERTELEIDCPNAELGMILNCSDNDSQMFVENIQPGSLAERCGAFQVGDVVAAINDTDVCLLTVQRANSLLCKFKKEPGKMVFVPGRKQQLRKHRVSQNNTKENFANNFVSEEPDQQVPPSSYVPHNSPSSLYRSITEKQALRNSQCRHLFYDFQISTISMFRSVAQNISNLYGFISLLRRSCRKDRRQKISKDESVGHKSPFVRIDPDRLSQLQAMCAETKSSTDSIMMHLIKNAGSCQGDDSRAFSSIGYNNECFSRDSLVHALADNLTDIHTKKLISRSSLNKMADILNRVELDCMDCYEACVSAAIATEKILLLISSSENTPKMQKFIKNLLEYIFKLKIPCDDCRKPWCSVSEQGAPTTNRITSAPSANSSMVRDDKLKVELEVEKKRAYFRVGHSQEDITNLDYDHDSSLKDFECSSGPNSLLMRLAQESETSHDTNTCAVNCEEVMDTGNYNQQILDKVHQEKDFDQQQRNVWKSDDVITKTRNATDSNIIMSTPIPKHSSLPRYMGFQCPSPVDASGSNVDFRSPASKNSKAKAGPSPECSPTENDRMDLSLESRVVKLVDKKSDICTMEVKLRNENKEYGLHMGFISLFSNDRKPVIKFIKSRSAAHKIGILSKGDRILAINGHSTVGLSTKTLEQVQTDAFSAKEVILTVEFDVDVHQLKYGTFDISLEKDIKAGLEFLDYKKASPLVVKGVVKGSAAHRSGLIFPGDEILTTNCIRQEVFDSVTCSYEKKQMIIMTIRRKKLEGTTVDAVESESDTCVKTVEVPTAVMRDKLFDIKSVLTRVVDKYGTMALEQELTLFRHPVSQDFGFLVIENKRAGCYHVNGIRPGSPADLCKAIKLKDIILEINGTVVKRRGKVPVLTLLLEAEERLDIKTRRILHCQ